MATSSIFRDIRVTDKAFCRSLINALEYSKNSKPDKEIVISKKVDELKGPQIKELFKE